MYLIFEKCIKNTTFIAIYKIYFKALLPLAGLQNTSLALQCSKHAKIDIPTYPIYKSIKKNIDEFNICTGLPIN